MKMYYVSVWFRNKKIGEMEIEHEYRVGKGQGKIKLNLEMSLNDDRELIMKTLFTDFMKTLKENNFVIKRGFGL